MKILENKFKERKQNFEKNAAYCSFFHKLYFMKKYFVFFSIYISSCDHLMQCNAVFEVIATGFFLALINFTRNCVKRRHTVYAEIGSSFRRGRILIAYIRRMFELGQLCATNCTIRV